MLKKTIKILYQVREAFGSPLLKRLEDKDDTLYKWWWDLTTPFVRAAEQVDRIIAWAKEGRESHDWDHAFLYKTMLFKMERMERCFVEYGNSIWCSDTAPEDEGDYKVWVTERKKMKSLRLCIKILKRLIDDEVYDMKQMDVLKEKYGDGKIDSKTEEYSPEYLKEFSERVAMAERKKAKERKILFTLMERDIEYWWD